MCEFAMTGRDLKNCLTVRIDQSDLTLNHRLLDSYVSILACLQIQEIGVRVASFQASLYHFTGRKQYVIDALRICDEGAEFKRMAALISGCLQQQIHQDRQQHSRPKPKVG